MLIEHDGRAPRIDSGARVGAGAEVRTNDDRVVG